MDDVRRLIALAARRLATASLLTWLHRVFVVAAGLALLLMIIDRLPASAFVPWTVVGPVLGGVALVVALVLWRRHRLGHREVALTVDDRLDLKERLVTALHFADRKDPFAQAAVADAVETARDPRVQERLKRRFAVQAPGGWWMSPLLVLLIVMGSFLGQAGLFSGDDEAPSAVREAADAANAQVEAVIEQIKEQPELSKALEDVLGETGDEATDPDVPQSEMEAKRDAIKKVTDLNRRLQELIEGVDGQAAKALDQKMRQLESPEDGAAKEMIEAMSRGDFDAASEALEKLMEAVESGELSEEQKQALAEQLQKLAEQLEAMSKSQEQLEKALENAGLDPKLATDAKALEQALQNSNLNEEQKKQLQQMQQAQMQACQMCKAASQAASDMAKACSGGAAGQMSESAQAMAGQLSQMEQLDQLMKQAMAAQSMCQGQCQGLGQGMGMQLALGQGKGGMGGRGQGEGGRGSMAPTPSSTVMQKAKSENTGQGPIIGQTLVEGPLEVGESSAAAREVLLELAEGFDEAQDQGEVPRRYEAAHKHYFGQVKQWAEKRLSEDEVKASSGPKPTEGSGGDEPSDDDA